MIILLWLLIVLAVLGALTVHSLLWIVVLILVALLLTDVVRVR